MIAPPRTPAQLGSMIRMLWIFVAVAALAVGYAGYSYTRQREFVAHATRTQGKIVGDVHTISRHNDHYTAIFAFTDETGKSWRVRDREINFRFSPHPFGEARTVLYDPADPGAAQLETSDSFFDTMGYALIPGFAGLAIGTIILLTIWHHSILLRRLRAAEGGGGTNPRDPAILSGP